MRLGEFRTKTRDFDNKLIIQVATYDETEGVVIHDVDLDIITDTHVFLRIIDDGGLINERPNQTL